MDFFTWWLVFMTVSVPLWLIAIRLSEIVDILEKDKK